MTDWAVWPIFITQCFAIILILFDRDVRILGIRLKTLSIGILVLVCILIISSVYHDSTDILNLHF